MELENLQSETYNGEVTKLSKKIFSLLIFPFLKIINKFKKIIIRKTGIIKNKHFLNLHFFLLNGFSIKLKLKIEKKKNNYNKD